MHGSCGYIAVFLRTSDHTELLSILMQIILRVVFVIAALFKDHLILKVKCPFKLTCAYRWSIVSSG